MTMLSHLIYFKSNHNLKNGSSHRYIYYRHHHRHPGEGPVTPQKLSPQLSISYHYTPKNPLYLGEPPVTLETPSLMNIIDQRTRPMEQRRCQKSQSLSIVTQYSNLARQTSFPVDGKGGRDQDRRKLTFCILYICDYFQNDNCEMLASLPLL